MGAKRQVEIKINAVWCKSCGICAEICPQDVYVENPGGSIQPKNINECTCCRLCEQICPDFAITLGGGEE